MLLLFLSKKTAIVATVNSPKINILGNAELIIDGDTSPSITYWTDYGYLETNMEVITKMFSIRNIKNQQQENIRHPIKRISSGMYIAKIYTSTEELNKKFIIP